MFRVLLLAGALLLPLQGFTQTLDTTRDTSVNEALREAYRLFQAGRYVGTRERLDRLSADLKARQVTDPAILGLLAYWSAITANRQVEYKEAIGFFQEAIRLDYRPKDLYYEYGQALYAMEKLPEARRAFAASLKRKYKPGVCLYYLGFISQTLHEDKQAVTFFRAIQLLPAAEQDDTLQPALVQVGDIYLAQAEKQPDSLKVVQSYVIPQYREALKVAPESLLANDIKSKITGLQQKYELVLFRMRNGRPTPVPPYFLRMAEDITWDSNPVYAAKETTNQQTRQSSLISKSEVFGRYTVFYKNIMSFSPELRMNYTRHLKRDENIFKNDNWLAAPALRSAFEHTLNRKEASFITDIDYSYSQRDRLARKAYLFNNRVTTVTVGERINGLIGTGDTTFRLRRRYYDSYDNTADSYTNGVGVEQVLPKASGHMLILTMNYDMTRVNNEAFDTNILFTRADLIFPAVWGFTPQAGFGLTITDPINDRDGRGLEKTWNPGGRLSRAFGKGWRLNLHADYMRNDSKDKENFAYEKTFFGSELEYVF